MTSRISFAKQIKEELKHHLASAFAVVLVTVMQLLSFYFELQDRLTMQTTNRDIIKSVSRLATPEFWGFLPTIGLAALLAAEYFMFLHSRKKSDFCLSLPIKRNKQFILGVCTCGIMFLVPTVIGKFIEIILVFTSGYGSAGFLYNMAWNCICEILIYAATWITMVLAMIMTGNTIIAVLGFIAFCCYIPGWIRNLVPTFEEIFYSTYAEIANSGVPWNYFSPISLAVGLTGYDSTWAVQEHANYLIAIVIFILALGIISLILYRKRPAEAAGRAMAFEKMKPIIRFALVIPLALYCGVILDEMSMMDSKGWLIIGTVLGAMLVHGIMESVYSFDMRKMVSKKRALAVSVLICVGFLAFLQLNTEKYNSYLPEENEVERIYLSVYDECISFGENARISDGKMGVSGETIRPILALAENAILEIEAADIPENSSVEISGDAYAGITIHYELKNGREEARQYSISLEKEENKALLDMIFATEDYKNDYYGLYNRDLSKLSGIWLNTIEGEEKLLLTDEEKVKFAEIYLKEHTKLSYSDLREKGRIAELTINYKSSSETETYYIYENFKETIAFLKEYGKNVGNPFANQQIISLDVWENEDGKEFTVTDPEILDEIKAELVLEEYYWGEDYYVYGMADSAYGNAEIMIGSRSDTKSVLIRESTMEKIKNAM